MVGMVVEDNLEVDIPVGVVGSHRTVVHHRIVVLDSTTS